MRTLLEEAEHIVGGERAGDYGENSLPAVARVWSEHVGAEITARDVAWMMVLLKSVRDRHKTKRDNLVDAVGYLVLADVNTKAEVEAYSIDGLVKAREALIPMNIAEMPREWDHWRDIPEGVKFKDVDGDRYQIRERVPRWLSDSLRAHCIESGDYAPYTEVLD